MDVLAVTDFPDIRCKCLIQSAHEGSILVIPREGGYLFRLYVELAKLEIGERVAKPQYHGRRAHRQGAADFPSLQARGEGGSLVVGVRDRPAADRQVR